LVGEVRKGVLRDIVTGLADKYNELVVEVFANVKRLGQVCLFYALFFW